LNLEECLSFGNGGRGVSVFSGATARVSNCTIADNGGTGLLNLGGTLESRRNNTIAGNTPDVSGTVTTISGQ